MDRLAISQVVLRMQSEHIRSALATEIEKFENAFEQILQTANAFLTATETVGTIPSFVSIEQNSVVKTVCQFLASSNTILEFLDFLEKKTGFASGGDRSLEKEVKAAQALVEQLLNTFLLHEKTESYPGKEFGFIYNEDVKLFGDVILHKHDHVEADDIPDPDHDALDRVRGYWHVEENIFSPLVHVPGTPWHKFFGNLLLDASGDLRLFTERSSTPSYFKAIIPETIEWLMPEIMADYQKWRLVFEQTGRLPPPYLPLFARDAKIKRIQNRLSNLFIGWKIHEDREILNFEDTREIPAPERDDGSGLLRMEALNAEINAVELTGIALPGHDIPRIPDYLEGEARKYCIEYEDMWD